MPTRIHFVRFRSLAFLLLLGAGACRSLTDANGQLDVTMSVSRLDVAPANPAEITVTIRNRGSDVVPVAAPVSYCSEPFRIRDAAGRSVDLPGRYCTAIAYAPRQFAPGDSVMIVDRWSGYQSDGNSGRVLVAPGEYRIDSRVFGAGRELTSRPVFVVVRP